MLAVRQATPRGFTPGAHFRDLIHTGTCPACPQCAHRLHGHADVDAHQAAVQAKIEIVDANLNLIVPHRQGRGCTAGSQPLWAWLPHTFPYPSSRALCPMRRMAPSASAIRILVGEQRSRDGKRQGCCQAKSVIHSAPPSSDHHNLSPGRCAGCLDVVEVDAIGDPIPLPVASIPVKLSGEAARRFPGCRR